MVLVLKLFLSVYTLFASPNFTALRHDQTVPAACYDIEINYFSFPMEKIYVGRKGALQMGFTYEYPVSRRHASTLWKYFKSLTHGEENISLLKKIKSNKELRRDYEIIKRNYQVQDFYFQNEGEVLEILAIEYLYQEYPENQYFITGGYEYHDDYSNKTIGELDIYIGNRSDCSVVAIGETKLGTRKMLNKAYKQIQRFENFLIHKNVGHRPKGSQKQPDAA